MLVWMVLAPIILAPLVGLLPQAARRGAWATALIPAALFSLLVARASSVSSGEVLRQRIEWLPALGMSLSFGLDGLSLLFALLITGIGTLIMLYASGYLSGEKRVFQFQAFLLLFMGAMLGLVLAENILALFVFWELTSISSYLLIGFEYRAPAARSAARMSLVITSGGGLALLGGLILLAQAAGSYDLPAILAQPAAIQASPLYGGILACVLLGAFTKSAQFPFHFWLPGAMAAPTPASAYLHSATMVKAGIYLMARFQPALGGTDAWTYTLVGFGLGTLLLGSTAALLQVDLKAILAYTTLAQLGALTAMIGLGAGAARALVVGILGHALYKAALFMAAGSVHHATHYRDIRKLGGLGRVMPGTSAAIWLAAISMAGLPPMLGFLAKEKLLAAFFDHGLPTWVLWATIGAIVLAGMLSLAVAFRLAWDAISRGRPKAYDHPPHEAGTLMLAGPLVLALLSVGFVFLPGVGQLLGAAAAAVDASPKITPVPLAAALWTGVNPPLIASIVAVALGTLLFAAREPAIAALARLQTRYSGQFIFERLLQALLDLAPRVGRPLEAMRLRTSLLLVFVTMIALAGWGLVAWAPPPVPLVDWLALPLHEVLVVVLVVISAIATVVLPTRLAAIAALGIVGAMVALIFALYSAPDLALTQLLVETLSLIFLLIAFARLPKTVLAPPSWLVRLRDVLIASAVGLVATGLTLMALGTSLPDPIFPYFVANSAPLANGNNVVNVILVDFRGFDTLGEITVLCTAALGAYAVLMAGRKRRAARAGAGERASAGGDWPGEVN